MMQDKLALNLYYIKNHSLFLDIKLIFKTIFSVG
ncbi:MAG: sugar transferase [Muribaculaceae bacterium]|nr:sugar transferase [Muribaculaceae bacterium]